MNTTFYRLVWKEYRAQRSLWLSLLIAAVILPVVIMTATSGDVPFEDLMTIGLTITVAFGVAAAAVAFAGEEDDGTAMWLRMFPLKTYTLLAGKLTIIAIGVVTLLAISTTFNAMLVQLFGNGLSRIDRGRNNEAIIDWLRATVGMSTFILLTLACALRSHKVFAALGWSAGCMVLFAILLMNTEEGPLSPFPLVVTALSALAVYPAVRQWHRGLRSGEPAAVAFVPGLSKPYSVIHNFLRGRDDVWSKRLIRAASASPPLSRTMRVLLWRELRFVVPFVRGCIAVAVLLLLAHVLLPDEQIPFLGLFYSFVIIECGLRTFRHDQQQLNGLFWSQRGVAPALVWAVRSVVWYLALWITVAAFIALERFVIYQFLSHAKDKQLQVYATEIVRNMALNFARPEMGGRSLWGPVAALVSGSFVISQLMSMWIRKPILAASCGFVGTLFYWVWIGYLTAFDFPLAMTAWPLIFLFLLAGFLTRRQWMDRRMSPKIILQRSVMVVFPCFCMWPAQMLWRGYEIPDVGFSLTLHQKDFGNTQLSNMSDAEITAYFSDYGYSEKNAKGKWAEAWGGFFHNSPASFTMSDMPNLQDSRLPTDYRPTAALNALDQILTADLRTHRLPPKYRVPWTMTPVAATNHILLGEGQRLFEANQLDEALTRVTQAVTLSRYLSQEATSWLQWRQAIVCELFAMEVLHRMIADDRLTEEQLARVGSEFHKASSFWTTGMNVTRNRAVVYQQLLHHRGYLWDKYNALIKENRNGYGGGTNGWPEAIINSNWAERRRMMNAIQLIASLNQSTGAGQQHEVPIEKVNRWLETSAANSQLDFIADPALIGGYESPQERLFRGVFNAERATGVMIVLQRYRRKHGHFPGSLLDLSEFGFNATDIRLREHSGSVLLGYAPHGVGFSMPVRNNFGHSQALAPDQPILYSQGSLSPLQLGEWAQKQKWKSSPVEPNRIWFINGSTILGLGEDVGFWGRNPPASDP
ncbi:MAG: hypothetical protein KDB01_10625 [Planctomycetaceae bacterium]|nr:hypothetical protein [Planctomycetaceae bacterium]